MKSLRGIVLEGEKLALEKTIENIPNRKPIKIKAEVQTYKDELYFQALEVVG